MKTIALQLLCLLGMLAGIPSVAQSTSLAYRGGGMIYDPNLNITWLQDANYAVTDSAQVAEFAVARMGQERRFITRLLGAPAAPRAGSALEMLVAKPPFGKC